MIPIGYHHRNESQYEFHLFFQSQIKMQAMKNPVIRILSMVLVAGIVTVAGCNKEDEKDLNKIIIAGNSREVWNGTYIPEAATQYGNYEVSCQTTLYYYDISIDFTGEASIHFTLADPTCIDAIPVGTFLVSHLDCLAGFNCWFSSGLKSADYMLESGTMKVSKSGDTYEVDLDCVFRDEAGGGTLKGNFKGVIPTATHN
jgi:hypothetical protein